MKVLSLVISRLHKFGDKGYNLFPFELYPKEINTCMKALESHCLCVTHDVNAPLKIKKLGRT